jgi:hypothetical protein
MKYSTCRKWHLILTLLGLVVLFSGFKESESPDQVMIRIKNDTGFDIWEVKIGEKSHGFIEYDHLKQGILTDYNRLPFFYRPNSCGFYVREDPNNPNDHHIYNHSVSYGSYSHKLEPGYYTLAIKTGSLTDPVIQTLTVDKK